MIEPNSNEKQIDELYSEATDHVAGEIKEKLKNVGLKGLNPLLNVLQKYRGDLRPYFFSLRTALQAGADSLSKEDASNSDKFVFQWINEGISWMDSIKTKFEGKNFKEVSSVLEEEGKKNPGAMFALSYVGGLVFGRLGRHLLSNKSTIH